MNQVKRITKHDAARRQLETAIILYFNELDQVSIHTLTCAAHEILRDLGQKSIIKDDMRENVYEHKKKKWTEMINEAENFFKHANKDQEKF